MSQPQISVVAAIASERRDWPFAFIDVCDFLAVTAKLVRTRLRVENERPLARA